MAAVALLAGGPYADAQSITGSLAGSVADSSGSIVPGATVKLTNEGNGQERVGVTESNGDFVFPSLAPGRYTIRVAATGFRPHERKGNVVLTGQRLAAGVITLQVGEVTETISVAAQGVGVQTESSNTALLDSRQVAMQGLRGRDPISMLRLLPGVEQGKISDMLGGSFGTAVPRFMGKDNNTIYVDGVNGGDSGGGGNFSGAVNPEAIEEISVNMTNYTAEYGRGGGPQINITTKGGGQRYHGTAYWFKRHEMFNATNFFNNAVGLRKPRVRFDNFGATLGGPIPILKRGGENTLFFFYSYDDTRTQRTEALRRYTLPTQLERRGDYSQSRLPNGSLIPVLDPANGQAPFPGNIVPISRRDANGAGILNIFAEPNRPGQVGYNHVTEWVMPHPRRQNLFRIDYRPTANDTISFKGSTWYLHQQGFEAPGSVTGNARWGLVEAVYDFTTDMATASYTKILSPRLVNEFMAGIFYSTENGPPVDDAALARLQRQTYGLQNLPQLAPANNPLNLVPMAQFSGLQHNSFNAAQINFDQRFPLTGYDTALTASNKLTYIRGSHTFKAGVWWEKAAFRQARASNFTGEFQFSHNSANPRSANFPFANAFLGQFNTYSESMGRVGDNRVQNTVAWFIQDTWKVTPRLTLDIGVRMYHWGRDLQQGGEASSFSFDRFDPRWGGNAPVLFQPVANAQGARFAQNPLTGALLPTNYIGTIVPGTGYSCTKPQSLENPCIINGIVLQENGNYVSGGRGFVEPLGIFYDPRFGLAWDIFGKGKTALRASWGTFHVAASGADRSFNFRQGGPSYEFTNQVVFGDIPTMLTAIPVTNPTDVEGTERTRKKQLNYQYSLGIQHEIGRQTVVDLSYVGNTSRHNPLNWNSNLLPSGTRFIPANRDPSQAPAAPNAASPRALPDNFLRPILGFSDITVTGNGGTDHYDSLQAQVTRRFTGGLELATAYTFQNGIQKEWYQQLKFARVNRNTSIQTHVLSLSYVIDVPRGSRLVPGIVGKTILDNWQISGVTTLSSGFPADVSLATTDNYDFTGGGESCGAQQTGPAILSRGERNVSKWFDTSVFRRPSGRGDIGNNCSNYKFRLPGINNWDISLFKNFPVAEGKKFQLRWEMYNVFNHTQFETVDTTARFDPSGAQVNANFGRVIGARQERRMQVALRFNF